MEEALFFQNVYYKYPDKNSWILKNFSLKIPKGVIWLIVGPIGSGKSTLLYLARGFHKIYGGEFKGRIFINNDDIDKFNFYEIGRKGVGWIAQDPSLNLHQLTVREEIRSSLIYHNLPWDVCVSLTESIITSLGLGGLADKLPTELSGGEMQRVAIAATLVLGYLEKSNDRILLLDEPDSFLDPKGKREFINILEKLRKTCTIVIVTHRFESYLNIADGMTIINNGENAINGLPQKIIYDETARVFLGRFPFVEIAKKLYEKKIISSYPLNASEFISLIKDKIEVRNEKEIPYKHNKRNAVVYKNVTYSYPNGNLGVYQSNAFIPTKSITAIIGNNGSGKTTLAKLTLNLLSKYTGDILLSDRELRLYNRNNISNMISYVTQIPKDMFITDTVKNECELLPKFKREPNFAEQALNAIKKAGLTDHVNQSIDDLSGGQSRLLSLAATIFLTASPLIILDEPEFGIDFKTWYKLFNSFLRLKENGGTVVILTHWLDSTLFCDHIIVMDKGIVVKTGHPNDIYRDKKLLNRIGIEAPPIYPLFHFLWTRGHKPKNVAEFIRDSLLEML